jgi:hypothetical protein
VTFSLGKLVATPGALAAISNNARSPLTFLLRHQAGDWGDISQEDRRENDFSVQNGLRILSAYRLDDGTKVWIITEADRSVTTILLPEEY